MTVGFQEIPCHMIFDVKMDFTRKARFVVGGHVTRPPATQTYASVVSRDSVRIRFLFAALNDLDIMSADIQGANLNVPCKENVCTMSGPEFGPAHLGKIALIVKALYGLKTSAFACREHLSETLQSSLELTPCYADTDVWTRPAVKLDGTEYYKFIFVQTDDLLVLSTNPKEFLISLDQYYMLKPGSIGKPNKYLGSEVGEYCLPDDPTKVRWYCSSEKYKREAV
jgi:Reverse transcriptase (RNA-dependent DNA polymerase)